LNYRQELKRKEKTEKMGEREVRKGGTLRGSDLETEGKEGSVTCVTDAKYGKRGGKKGKKEMKKVACGHQQKV